MPAAAYYPLDLPESVKSLPVQSGNSANLVPPSDNRVYPVSDLMKLAPVAIQDKYPTLVTFKMSNIKNTENKVEPPQDGTEQHAAEAGTDTAINNVAEHTTELTAVDGPTPDEEVSKQEKATGGQPDAGNAKPEGGEAASAGGGGEKKKKKKKKSKTMNADGTPKPKKVTPTGFEPFYADAPITPEVYKDEMSTVYHHRQFHERIEACVVRYKEKRKLNSARGDMFNKYLTLGGVDTSIKQFQGGAAQDQNDDSDDEPEPGFDGPTPRNVTTGVKPVSSIFDTTQGAISKYYNPFAPQNWAVDFVGCAKAYLSNRAPFLFGINDDEAIEAYCEVVINFLNYVLMHSVCPEYTNDILQAQQVARVAKKELKDIYILADLFPGPFSRAISILTGSEQGQIYLYNDAEIEEKKALAQEEGADFVEDRYFTIPKCKSVVQAAISILGTPEQIHLLAELKEGDTIKVLKHEKAAYEVVSIQYPTADQEQEFAALHFESGPVKPMGFLHVKPWTNPTPSPPEDLSPSEALLKARAAARLEKANLARLQHGEAEGEAGDNTPSECFIVSAHVLRHIHPGMAFECTVGEVAGGVRFIEHSKRWYASFFETIENEKMVEWKTPRRTERKPPTCEDAEAGGEEEGGDGDV